MFEALERTRVRERLSRAFETTRGVGVLDFEVKGLLGRHLCVISAGALEESVRLHIAEYARITSRGFIGAFVSRRTNKLTNLSSERLVAFLRDLDDTIADEMDTYLDDRRKSAINSLISLRHLVAHGKDSGVSLATVTQYKDVVLEVLDKLDEIFARISA